MFNTQSIQKAMSLYILVEMLHGMEAFDDAVTELINALGGKEAVRKAIIDTLTNLANRDDFVGRVRLAVEESKSKAIIFEWFANLEPGQFRTLVKSLLAKVYPEDFPDEVSSAEPNNEGSLNLTQQGDPRPDA